jgi:hypothetical protein
VLWAYNHLTTGETHISSDSACSHVTVSGETRLKLPLLSDKPRWLEIKLESAESDLWLVFFNTYMKCQETFASLVKIHRLRSDIGHSGNHVRSASLPDRGIARQYLSSSFQTFPRCLHTGQQRKSTDVHKISLPDMGRRLGACKLLVFVGVHCMYMKFRREITSR